MELLIMGLTVSFNIIIILWKFSKDRIADAVLDASILATVTFIFSGTYSALVVGTIASCVVSIYLLINPPKIGILQ